jgi:hypothetical protein
MGFGYPMRAVTLYEKLQTGLFADEGPPLTGRASRRRKQRAREMGNG